MTNRCPTGRAPPLAPSSITNPTSLPGDNWDGSVGEATFTYTLRDASSNPISPPADVTVQFTENTASKVITNSDGITSAYGRGDDQRGDCQRHRNLAVAKDS